jgi:hypothetical protein
MDQPFDPWAQIAGEGVALADGMLIPIRRYGDIDLPGSPIAAGRMRRKHRRLGLAPLMGPLAVGPLWSGLAGRRCLRLWRGQRPLPSLT